MPPTAHPTSMARRGCFNGAPASESSPPPQSLLCCSPSDRAASRAMIASTQRSAHRFGKPKASFGPQSYGRTSSGLNRYSVVSTEQFDGLGRGVIARGLIPPPGIIREAVEGTDNGHLQRPATPFRCLGRRCLRRTRRYGSPSKVKLKVFVNRSLSLVHKRTAGRSASSCTNKSVRRHPANVSQGRTPFREHYVYRGM